MARTKQETTEAASVSGAVGALGFIVMLFVSTFGLGGVDSWKEPIDKYPNILSTHFPQWILYTVWAIISAHVALIGFGPHMSFFHKNGKISDSSVKLLNAGAWFFAVFCVLGGTWMGIYNGYGTKPWAPSVSFALIACLWLNALFGYLWTYEFWRKAAGNKTWFNFFVGLFWRVSVAWLWVAFFLSLGSVLSAYPVENSAVTAEGSLYASVALVAGSAGIVAVSFLAQMGSGEKRFRGDWIVTGAFAILGVLPLSILLPAYQNKVIGWTAFGFLVVLTGVSIWRTNTLFREMVKDVRSRRAQRIPEEDDA